jgi:hypothetical protein
MQAGRAKILANVFLIITAATKYIKAQSPLSGNTGIPQN